MSNTKHTAGPWVVTTLTINKPEDRGGCLIVTGYSSDKSDCPAADIVCTMQLRITGNKYNFIQDEAYANAKLIAAAPENLEGNEYMTNKVKECINVLRRYIVPDGIDAGQAITELIGLLDNTEIVNRISASEAAIQKATS